MDERHLELRREVHALENSLIPPFSKVLVGVKILLYFLGKNLAFSKNGELIPPLTLGATQLLGLVGGVGRRLSMGSHYIKRRGSIFYGEI